LRLAYFNPWWFRFARENGGEPSISLEWKLGRSLMDAVPDALKSFYRELYNSVFQRDPSSLHPLQHRYECSSADTFRVFVMTLYSLGEGEGILVVNSLVVETPHDPAERKNHDPDPETYVGADGLIRQCSNCRRIKNMKEPNRWDWVSDWVANPPVWTSDTICNFCLGYYYRKTEEPHK
jgi:hypothetical protein